MESKVKELLYLRSEMFHDAARRQDWIDTNDFQMAMYHQFMFLSRAEQFGAIKNSMTQKEYAEYLAAMLCWDYK